MDNDFENFNNKRQRHKTQKVADEVKERMRKESASNDSNHNKNKNQAREEPVRKKVSLENLKKRRVFS